MFNLFYENRSGRTYTNEKPIISINESDTHNLDEIKLQPYIDTIAIHMQHLTSIPLEKLESLSLKTADKNRIENEIKTMPNYFSDYHTIVHFISEDELIKNHNKMSHGGFVIHSAEIENNKYTMEYSLKLDSNPEFTALVLISLARANYKMHKLGEYGAKTILDIPPAYLSEKTSEQLRRELL